MKQLPSGTVTFLFTDIEGSTRMLHELGPERYSQALAEHRRVLRAAFERHGGVEVDTQGDAFFVAFPSAPGALAAAGELGEALGSGPIRVRVGIHTGRPHLEAEGYVGPDVHLGARIAAAGHGGQVLVSGQTAELVEAELAELGEHRLKDFDEAVPIFQLGSEPFPPLKTISNTNLPRPASSFVGRERELEEVTELVRDGSRLLTLSGPGGSGKTRLALEAASDLVPEFKAGVFWVALAPLRDADLVSETIAQTLGAKDGLADHIGERELLLLLDNLEQVVEAAAELGQLLEQCPNLKLLVTSRELLCVRGEIEYAVPPLSEPEAVALFCERAQLASDETISELCRRLDNLPLAVELAAARARLLSPKQILERISKRLDLLKGGRDAEARQQTLRGAIEWSYDLLEPEERRLFGRLSVFAGGCTLEAAEHVADADLDVLQSLIDKSLVRRTDERFWMLETIREFAGEKLEQSGDAEELRIRHAEHLLALTERAYEDRNAAQSEWLSVVAAEHDNIRAALDWAQVARADAEVRLAAAVAPYWALRGHLREVRTRLAGAIDRYEPRDPVRARALTQLAIVDDPGPAALARASDALEISRAENDILGEGLALEAAGLVHLYSGEYDAARRAFEASLSVRRRGGAPELENAAALGGLCQLHVAAGEIAEVEPMARELYALGSQHGNPDMQADALHYLADCPLLGGHFVEAERRYSVALAHARREGFVAQCPTELLGVAMAAAGRGDHARAVRLAAAAHARREALGLRRANPSHWWTKLQRKHIGGARASLPPDEADAAEHAGRNAAFDDILDEVLREGGE
jgi:predicted ATPase